MYFPFSASVGETDLLLETVGAEPLHTVHMLGCPPFTVHFISFLISNLENIVLALGGKIHLESAYKLHNSFTLLRKLFKGITN